MLGSYNQSEITHIIFFNINSFSFDAMSREELCFLLISDICYRGTVC